MKPSHKTHAFKLIQTSDKKSWVNSCFTLRVAQCSNKQTNKKENKNKLLNTAVSATVIRLWRNWSLSNGQQEHEKYKRNKMKGDFRWDPPSHEACSITRIIYVTSATATDTALLGKIKAIPFITHPQIVITSSLFQREVKTRLFGCPSPKLSHYTDWATPAPYCRGSILCLPVRFVVSDRKLQCCCCYFFHSMNLLINQQVCCWQLRYERQYGGRCKARWCASEERSFMQST